MITNRLNRLITAYRIAKAQVGDANRGKARPGICLRRCHRLRQVIWAEIRYVEQCLEYIRNPVWPRPTRYRSARRDFLRSLNAAALERARGATQQVKWEVAL